MPPPRWASRASSAPSASSSDRSASTPTHGRNAASSVPVYSAISTGFNTALAGKGVTYQGLSPVAATTQQQALAHVSALGNDNGGQPLVFRTSFTVARGSGRPGTA